uniref:Uncharacterized protein n=1 Tax=Rhizophagus irregularis (strain DAOM 181602 / DAOM 197198 / MUCL 43194) TaxID=747089 RepID=U9U1Q9_RHIID
MAEIYNKEVRGGGERLYKKCLQISAVHNYHVLGLLGSSLDVLLSAVKGDEIRGANGIYNKESRTIGGKYNAIQPNPVAESRVEKMNVLRWASDVENVLTEEELIKCRHNLGNCSESVTWAAMYGTHSLSRNVLSLREPSLYSGRKINDPRELIYYINRVAEFGFNHIIIVGETEYGMIFIDCYGRVFMWDDESPMLWPLGNSPEEVPKQTIKGKMC